MREQRTNYPVADAHAAADAVRERGWKASVRTPKLLDVTYPVESADEVREFMRGLREPLDQAGDTVSPEE